MKKVIFPTRLFRWFLGKQILTTAISFAVAGFFLWIWFDTQSNLSRQSLEQSHLVIFASLLMAFIIVVTISVVMARRLVIPLGRLIAKTVQLRKYPFDDEVLSEKELAFDEPGEWYDLERALNKLGYDLRQKTIRLSREKTELRAIISAMSEAVLAVDIHRHPLFYNPQFAVLFNVEGTDSDDVVLSELVRDPFVLKAYEQSLFQGISQKVKLDLELNEAVHHFEVSVAPLKKKHNQEVYGAVAVFHDVTDMKKAEQIRIDFVGNVSHELRTPLTSIKGYLQTARMDIEKGQHGDVVEFLTIVEKNVDRLKALADDLLDLSRIESGEELKKKMVNTRELTENVIDMLQLKEHILHLSYQVEQFEADQFRVEQVLRNLLQNAVRYVPKGKNIWIGWEKSPEGQTLLKVKDDGPGIPKKHHERLFERFYRIDESRSRELGGTGIGLSLVKHIMNSHGGTVSLVSSPGEGSEFICNFPLKINETKS